MEKIKNICCDLGRAFTIGLLSGGAAAAVLLLGGFLFGGFTFRAALEAAKRRLAADRGPRHVRDRRNADGKRQKPGEIHAEGKMARPLCRTRI